jgi:DNA-binding NarL/FixJ family response regulator
VRIVIVEDHLMFREVIRKVCTKELGHEVVGEADDGKLAVDVVGSTNPELVLLDLHLPSLDGFAVVEAIRRKAPLVKILVLSSHCDEYTVYRSERAHVQGFVDKNTSSVEALKTAISTIAAGRVWYSEAFLEAKSARHRNPRSFDKLLTDRERVVLALVGLPLTDAEISRELAISEATVEKHRFNILRKLELRTTAELARYARDHGFTLIGGQSDGALLS